MLILSVTGGIAGVDMLAINFLGPFVAADLNLNNADLGLIALAQLVAWSLAAIVTALLSDRWGRRKPFLVTALICFALFSGVTAMASSLVSLIAARVLIGLAEGPVIPMQNAIMLSSSSPHRRGLNLGLVQNFGSQLLGALVGPLMLVWIATHFGGWRNAFLIAGLPALAIAVIVHFCIREVGVDTACPHDAPEPLMRTIGSIMAVRNIRLCFLIGTCAIAWFGTMLTFIPLWAMRVLHYSPMQMSLAMGSIGVAGAVAAVLVPWLSDRVGRRPAIAAFALFGTIVPLGLLSGAHDLATVCGIIFTGSLFMGIFPLFIGAVPMESVDARHGASALAIVMGGAQIFGGIIGPLSGGLLADRFSLAATLYMACGLALLAASFAVKLTETAPLRKANPGARISTIHRRRPSRYKRSSR